MRQFAVSVAPRLTVLVLSAVVIAAPAAHAASPAPATFEAAFGGQLQDGVTVGTLHYLPTGVGITAWSLAEPGAPVLVGDTSRRPASGYLTGIARSGNLLYATSSGYDDANGNVVVYDITRAQQPTLLREVPYTDAGFRRARSLAVQQGHLYVLDNENGVFVSPLLDPAQPQFALAVPTFGSYDFAFTGNARLYGVGRNFIGGTGVEVFGTAAPEAPTSLATASLDGFDNFRVRMAGNLAVGFGLALAITDFGDPAEITPRGRADSQERDNGAVVGTHAYATGSGAMDVWSIANPDAPMLTGTLAAPTFVTDSVGQVGTSVLFGTRAARLTRIDATAPGSPTLAGSATLAGVESFDVAEVNGALLLLGSMHGYSLLDPATLRATGRFDVTLPENVRDRDMETMAVDGDRAYLAAWGTGIVIVDVSDPAVAVQLGVAPLPFAAAVAARGAFVYAGRSTNGGLMQVFDVSEPAAPKARGSLKFVELSALQLDYPWLYVADSGSGALHVVDVSDADAPAIVATVEGLSAHDVVAYDAGHRVIVAGGDALHVLDVSDPAAPAPLGTWSGDAAEVAVRGTRAWAGGNFGVTEVDIADPQAMTTVATHAIPVPVRAMRALSGGRVAALTGLAGTWTFRGDVLFVDGLDD